MSDTIYLPEPARITNVRPMTELEKVFTLEFANGRSLGHEAGQFVAVSVLGVGEAPFSISSSPSRSNGTFELCVRRVGDLTSVIHSKSPGDTLGIRGPLGRGFPSPSLGARTSSLLPVALDSRPFDR
jgi:sulfhydrogenase subunit gamma (sulfur reductase)